MRQHFMQIITVQWYHSVKMLLLGALSDADDTGKGKKEK